MHILWLKTELLHPLDKGGRIRTYHMLRALNRLHEVTYLTLDDGSSAPDAIERAREYCTNLIRVPFQTTRKGSRAFYLELAQNLVSPLPYAVWKYRSRAYRRQCELLLATGRIDVVVCDFLFPAVNVPAQLQRPAVLFQHNVEADIWRRHSDVASQLVTRAYFRSQWRRMVAFERASCRRFDHVIAVSERDRERFQDDYGARTVSAVPTGVDTAFFQPTPSAVREPAHLVFTGSMDWMPNEDGITFFADHILPLVHRQVPEARVTVVGRHPTEATLNLARRDPRVHVTGRVPDIRPFLERAAAVIVPLRIGGGTRLKIFEAMAMECAVISTSVGAEGLPIQNGIHLVVADSPAEFAHACVTLLRDPASAQRLGTEAATYVRTHFGWAAAAESFADICRIAARETPVPVAEES